MSSSDRDATGVFTMIKGELREIHVELTPPEVIEFCRSCTLEQRWKASAYLTKLGRELHRKQIAESHPEWSAEEVEQELRTQWLADDLVKDIPILWLTPEIMRDPDFLAYINA